MVAYLDTLGVRRAIIEGPCQRPARAERAGRRLEGRPTPSAILYDLSDPVRLAASSADTRPLAPGLKLPGLPRCVYGPLVPRVPTVADAR